jgi:predicted ester cyclase
MDNQAREVAARWFEEVWNKGRREAIAEMLLPDAIIHDGAKDGRGPEGFYPFFDRLQAACSDIRIRVEQTIVEHDLVCVRWFATMKHTGDGLGIAPTGRTLEATGISILRIAGGKLVEGWQNWDMLGMMQQIRETDGAAALYV